MRLMSGDLNDGIGRSIEYRLAGPDMLLAIFVDDIGAGGMLVAEDAGQLCAAHGIGNQTVREMSGWSGGNNPS